MTTYSARQIGAMARHVQDKHEEGDRRYHKFVARVSTACQIPVSDAREMITTYARLPA